jgi:hypothetical protein
MSTREENLRAQLSKLDFRLKDLVDTGNRARRALEEEIRRLETKLACEMGNHNWALDGHNAGDSICTECGAR